MKEPSRSRAPRQSSSCLSWRRRLLLACCLTGAASAADISRRATAPSRLPTPGGGLLAHKLNVHNHDVSTCVRLVDVRMQGGDVPSAVEQR